MLPYSAMQANQSSPMHPFGDSFSRRSFLRQVSCGLGAALAMPRFSAMAGPDPYAGQEMPAAAAIGAFPPDRKLGIALVGLGGYSEGQLAPALQQTKLCRLAGIVTGTPEKASTWKTKYNIPDKNVYSYETFDQIANNPDIDIIYVVLPNALHAEYVIKAAQAGKHVICEKPLATSVEDCKRMIDACNQANKKLSVGYRLHFEPHNQEMMRLGQKEVFGPLKKIYADNGFRIGDPKQWRLNQALSGGGPLMDVGIYCVQGVIYTKGQNPVSVTAKFHEKTDLERFKEVEQGIDWQMQFADGTSADCKTSYAEGYGRLRAEAAKGWFELNPAYGYGGLKGETSRGPMDVPNVPQQAFQMDDFADCIINNKPTRVPGEMGMRDVEILYAIYRAAETGQKVRLGQAVNAVGNR